MTAGPVVLKLGGRALEAEGALAALAADLAPLAGRIVLVHGGGAEVSTWSERLGLVPRFHGGRRVTDEATLEVAAAVLAGLANKRLVAGLAARGIDAVGLAALDGGTLRAAPHRDAAALGAVGQVVAVEPGLVRGLLADGRVPVIAPLGAHAGALLNLNADDVATALAQALGAAALVLLSDTPGLVLGGRVAACLDPAAAEAALAGPEVQGGMKPKLEAALAAVRGGVGRAVIGAWQGPGTLPALVAARAGTCICEQPVSVPEDPPHGA